MELITILNRCHRFRGFVYQHAHFSADKKSIEVAVRPPARAAICRRPLTTSSPNGALSSFPCGGFVNCRRCGIVPVEEVPWGDGKRTLTKAYLLFLARWARRLSWKETAETLRTSWDKVFDAVEHVVTFWLEHRAPGSLTGNSVQETFTGVVTKIFVSTAPTSLALGNAYVIWLDDGAALFCQPNPTPEQQTMIGLIQSLAVTSFQTKTPLTITALVSDLGIPGIIQWVSI